MNRIGPGPDLCLIPDVKRGIGNKEEMGIVIQKGKIMAPSEKLHSLQYRKKAIWMILGKAAE